MKKTDRNPVKSIRHKKFLREYRDMFRETKRFILVVIMSESETIINRSETKKPFIGWRNNG